MFVGCRFFEGRSHRTPPKDTFEPINDLESLASLLVGDMPARIWIKDEHGRYVFVNSRLADEIGLDRESWIGSSDDELFPEVGHVYWRKDQQVLSTSQPLVSTDQVEKQKFVFSLRFPLTIEGRIHVAGIAVETTEHMSALVGIIRLRDEAFRNERLRALGEMASGLVHDFRNMLNAAALRLDILRRKAGDDLAAEVDALDKSIKAASDRVGALQSFVNARREEQMQLVHLAGLIRDAIEMVVFLIERTPTERGAMIKVDCRIPDSLPTLLAPPNQLKHVISNLLLNARDAMPDGGKIRIAARQTSSKIEMTVEDEGTGIDADPIDKIFEPFFSTKRFGNGLGLSMARDVMSRIRGTITAANRNPGGSVFTLTFPIIDASESKNSRLFAKQD